MQIEGVDGKYVAVEDDEIPTLARLEAAGRALLLQGIGRIGCVGVDDVLDGDALLGQKGFLTPGVRAGDSVLHRLERIESADAPVAAAGDASARVAQ